MNGEERKIAMYNYHYTGICEREREFKVLMDIIRIQRAILVLRERNW